MRSLPGESSIAPEFKSVLDISRANGFNIRPGTLPHGIDGRGDPPHRQAR
jgi:hypothetical protein